MQLTTLLVSLSFGTFCASAATPAPQHENLASVIKEANRIISNPQAIQPDTFKHDGSVDLDALAGSKLAIESLVKKLGLVALAAAEQDTATTETIPGVSMVLTILQIMEQLLLIDWNAMMRGEINWKMIFDKILNLLLGDKSDLPKNIIIFLEALEKAFMHPKAGGVHVDDALFDNLVAELSHPLEEDKDGKVVVTDPIGALF